MICGVIKVRIGLVIGKLSFRLILPICLVIFLTEVRLFLTFIKVCIRIFVLFIRRNIFSRFGCMFSSELIICRIGWLRLIDRNQSGNGLFSIDPHDKFWVLSNWHDSNLRDKNWEWLYKRVFLIVKLISN